MSQYAIIVSIHIKISNLFNNDISSIVRFLEDVILFVSDLFATHLDPPSWALFCVTCKFQACF